MLSRRPVGSLLGVCPVSWGPVTVRGQHGCPWSQRSAEALDAAAPSWMPWGWFWPLSRLVPRWSPVRPSLSILGPDLALGPSLSVLGPDLVLGSGTSSTRSAVWGARLGRGKSPFLRRVFIVFPRRDVLKVMGFENHVQLCSWQRSGTFFSLPGPLPFPHSAASTAFLTQVPSVPRASDLLSLSHSRPACSRNFVQLGE